MHLSTLDILRCPYCGGRLELVTSLFHRRDGDEIHDGILGCHCCIFAVIDGIPVMHLEGDVDRSAGACEAGRPDLARRAMFNLTDEGLAARFDELASSTSATYREVVEALGPSAKAATSCTASPTRPISCATRWFAPWPAPCCVAVAAPSTSAAGRAI